MRFQLRFERSRKQKHSAAASADENHRRWQPAVRQRRATWVCLQWAPTKCWPGQTPAGSWLAERSMLVLKADHRRTKSLIGTIEVCHEENPVFFTAALILTLFSRYNDAGMQENISPITSHSCSCLLSF